MKSIQQFLQRPWLYIFIALIGIALKFYRVDYHYFWFDETAAIEHTSGFSGYDTYQSIPKNKILNISYYKDLFHLNKRNLKLGEQLKGISQLTNLNPLHYWLLAFWYRIAGDDAADYRWFNIFIFILTIPCLFLLTKKLFKSDLSGWIAISLFAVSPFFHYTAHEARYNMLLTFLLILNNYLFLVAIDQNKIKWWIGYTVVGILTLYASIISSLLFIGHFGYLLIFKRKIWIAYGVCTLIIFLGYLPWLVSIYNNRTEISTSLEWHIYFSQNQNFLTLILAQLSMMARSFATLNDRWLYLLVYRNFEGNYFDLCANLLIAILLVYSIIYSIRKTDKKTSYFLVLLVVPQCLFFFISDLVRGTGCSLIHRYQLIGIIGILFFIVFLFSRKISLGKLTYSGIYTGIVILGLISIFVMSKDRCWTTGITLCRKNIEDATLYSNSRKPLLITGCYLPIGTGIGGFMAIMNECESDSLDIMQVYPDVENLQVLIPDSKYSVIYLAYFDTILFNNLKMQPGLKMDSLEVEGISDIWQIKL